MALKSATTTIVPFPKCRNSLLVSQLGDKAEEDRHFRHVTDNHLSMHLSHAQLTSTTNLHRSFLLTLLNCN